MDDHLFPSNKELSAGASLGLGVLGLYASQGLVDRAERLSLKVISPRSLALARFGAIYTVAMSCVLVWRGTWVGWDCLYERYSRRNALDPGHATTSGVLSHVIAIGLLLTTGLFASVLAPPAQISVLRDATIRSKTYRGPVQSIVNEWFGSSGLLGTSSNSAASKLLTDPSTNRALSTKTRTRIQSPQRLQRTVCVTHANQKEL